MVANELRIGNWVKIKEEFSSDRDFPLETLEFQIEGFNDGSNRYEEGAKQILFWNIKNKVFGTTSSGSYDIECEPILLTEEWLLKFGFIKAKFSSEYWSHYSLINGWNVALSHHTEESSGVNKDLVYWGDNYVELKYVHQLQNLYFALTGEELIIKSE